MAPGEVHDSLGMLSTVSLAMMSAITGEPLLMVSSIGALCATICTPDIDHHVETLELKRIRKLFGRGVQRMWKIYWIPFRMVKHRSCVSHSWPWGSLLRFSWFFWIPMSLTYYFDPERIPLEVFPWMFLGWSLSDWLHLAADGLYSRMVGICGK